MPVGTENWSKTEDEIGRIMSLLWNYSHMEEERRQTLRVRWRISMTLVKVIATLKRVSFRSDTFPALFASSHYVVIHLIAVSYSHAEKWLMLLHDCKPLFVSGIHKSIGRKKCTSYVAGCLGKCTANPSKITNV